MNYRVGTTAQKVIPGIFFAVWLLIGLMVYKDYGVSMDEPIERTTGIVSVSYIINKLKIESLLTNPVIASAPKIELSNYADRAFGPLFAQLSVALEMALNIGEGVDQQKIYEFRHLLTFILVWIGGFSIYALAKRRFHSWQYGLLAVALFIFTPRFFAESFYNNKDLVFLAFFATAMNAAVQFSLKPTWKWALLLGLITGATIDIRIGGVFIALLTVYLLCVRLCWQPRRLSTVLVGVTFIVSTALTTILFWPWLWEAPWSHFLQAISGFSQWTRSYLNIVFIGQQYTSTTLPWFYIPTWIGITTPPVYLFFFLVGAIAAIKSLGQCIKTRDFNPIAQQDFIFLSLFFGPILAVIILHSVVYDGWRHLYFVYIPFILLATNGIEIIWRNLQLYSLAKTGFAVGIVGTFAWNAQWMIANHPLQNTYFNQFAGKDLKDRFDVDYWGLSSKAALEYIAKHDNQPILKIAPGSFLALEYSIKILGPQERARLVPVSSIQDADYLITNFRNNPTDYSKDTYRDQFTLFHEILVDDEVVSAIYQRKKRNSAVQIKPDHPLSFSLNGSGATFMGSGWAASESWGTWSNGYLAYLALPMPEPAPHFLTLQYHAFILPQHTEQSIEIWVNNQFAQNIVAKNPENTVKDIPLPPLNQKDPWLLIEFRVHNPVRPKDFGIGADDRLLGIGLKSLQFH